MVNVGEAMDEPAKQQQIVNLRAEIERLPSKSAAGWRSRISGQSKSARSRPRSNAYNGSSRAARNR